MRSAGPRSAGRGIVLAEHQGRTANPGVRSELDREADEPGGVTEADAVLAAEVVDARELPLGEHVGVVDAGDAVEAAGLAALEPVEAEHAADVGLEAPGAAAGLV